MELTHLASLPSIVIPNFAAIELSIWVHVEVPRAVLIDVGAEVNVSTPLTETMALHVTAKLLAVRRIRHVHLVGVLMLLLLARSVLEGIRHLRLVFGELGKLGILRRSG